MMTGGGGKKRLMSDINVTPFVDVMLVLLIIFMVTAPMMIQGEDVNLPQTESKPVKTKEDPLILTVNKKQEISLEKTSIPLNELDEKLRSFFKYRDNKELLLRADEAIPWGFVAKVIARVKGAGIEKVSLITEPEK
ncbi:MAG: ExbD/TolR family protein [Deltaproteobacteria bacterium]|nr:ExbD/TolR family protein [Deltaproteobacteria bacterium]